MKQWLVFAYMVLLLMLEEQPFMSVSKKCRSVDAGIKHDLRESSLMVLQRLH